MSETGIRTIFGIAVTSANVRATSLGFSSIRSNLCKAFGKAFGLGEDDSSSIFNYFKNNNTKINTTEGFRDTNTYRLYETDVFNIIDAYLPSAVVNENEKKILALSAHAIIFGYSLASSVKIETIQTLIGKTLSNVADLVNEHQVFTADSKGVIFHPFTPAVITTLLANDYSLVLEDINTSPRNTEVSLTNYNWYDTAMVFSNPNLQIMKDVENQYYYVSGQLIYQSFAGNLPTCIEDIISVSTISGVKQTTYIRNTPCVDENSYVGPVTGVNFFRIFNDGPPSSGDFSADTKKAYVTFDKNILKEADYHSNAIKIYSFITGADGQFAPIYDGDTFIDANGRVSLSAAEYINAPISTGCSGVYQRMHIGDNLPRIRCADEIKCLGCAVVKLTGFKYAALETNPVWANKYLYYQTNPVSDTGRIIKRNLNIDENAYRATDVGDELQTFTYDDFNNQVWYVGPPQLNGKNSLPSLAFYQKFENTTFGETASIVLFPSIGTSEGNTGIESVRTFVTSTIPLTSGVDGSHYKFDDEAFARATFIKTIGSEFKNHDNVYREFFGMGDNFNNQFSINAVAEENAGYFYTGFSVLSGTGVVNTVALLEDYSGYLLGSRVKNIRFISGYQNGNIQLGYNKMLGQDFTGNIHAYYYFDDRNYAEPIKETGWSIFSELPDYLDSHYDRVYTTEQVENYFPRYSSGPYSVETRKFLYPNAALAGKVYIAKQRGFPKEVEFTIELREEAVKEIFGTYQITKDGTTVDEPVYNRVVRPSSSGIDFLAVTPYMRRMFYPDEPQYNYEFDFNNFKIGTDFSHAGGLEGVDNNWAPLWNGFAPSGKTNVVYNGYFDMSTIFSHGIRMTGNFIEAHAFLTGTGELAGFKFFYSELPLNVGLYHGFKTYEKDVKLQYVLPIFSLATSSLEVSSSLISAFPVTTSYQGAFIRDYQDRIYTLDTGVDPLFYEYVGGRRGSATATVEGGYNSHGFIGDRWNGMVYENYGTVFFHDTLCGKFGFARAPVGDDRILVFNSTPTGTELWTRALAFSPFKFDRSDYRPFTTTDRFFYSLDGHTGQLTTTKSGDCININLSDYLPLKSTTGQEWYSNSGGLNIGPFDRDTEIVVLGTKKVIAFTDLYVNSVKITNLYNPNTCDYDLLDGQIINSGIIPNEFGRAENLTIVSEVPSGSYLKLNIFSNPTIGGDGHLPAGYPAETKIGILTGSLLSFRARKPIDGSYHHSYIHSGEEYWLNPSNFTNNGTEKIYSLSHPQGFNGLEGTHEYVTYTQTGKLYPIPGNDFTGMGEIDAFGNIHYQSSDTVEEYWKNYARRNRKNVFVTGWREGSRVSFRIKNLRINYDEIPYQAYRIVIPSGQCTVSGEMGYYSQADQSIFSEGICLVNNTEEDQLKVLFNPSFVSTVISRVPFFTMPSGTTQAPVYEAPSVVKQRATLDFPLIQTYSGLLSEPPDNYNKLLWPALSDLETLNPGETMESIPPDDGNTFSNSTMIFSAAQGQRLSNGKRNPHIIKVFDVKDQYQLYDSVSTDALANPTKCITSGRGQRVRFDPQILSGVIAPVGTPLSLAVKGVI